MAAFRPADDDDLVPAIGYIRVSMAREEMISPDLQRAAIESWAERRRRRIVHWVIDLDATGRNFKRKIMKAIGYIEDGTAQEIAAWKYSRFGRDRHGNAVNLERVERAGGQLESATEEVDARTAVGRFQRGMLLEVAAFESDRAGEVWKETHQWRRDQGLPASGQKRFGYIWHPRRIPQLDGTFRIQEERYEPNPELAPVVLDLYQRYVEGDGFLTLAGSLNERKIPNARGNVWDMTVLRRYMDHGFAAGFLRLHDPACTRPYRWDCPAHKLVRHPTHQHPAIISDELWQQYLQRRARVKTTPPRARAGNYPLAGLVKCGLCGSGVHRGHSNKGKDHQYACRLRKTQGKALCPGIYLSERLTEEALRTWLAENMVMASVDHERIGAPDPSPARSEVASTQSRRAALQEQITRLERGIARQMRSYALVDDDDADGLLEKEHQLTLRSLRTEKSELTAALRALDEVPDEVKAEEIRAASIPIIESLHSEWETLPSPRLNALLQQVVRRIEIHGGRCVEVIPVWAAA